MKKFNFASIKAEKIFPPLDESTKEGIVAYGGDLSPRIVLNAYCNGIFPWFSDDEVPIMWWSPDPRMVVFPEDLHISKTMNKILCRDMFTFSYDKAFMDVVENCSRPRQNQPGTWITEDMKNAYQKLHVLGFAHSLEVWQDKKLVGGLYGIAIGKCFFGESMFASMSNASKFAFICLLRDLKKKKYHFVDCQVSSEHLISLGAREIPRSDFLKRLRRGIDFDTEKGPWRNLD